jgi:succinyl-CoA synthetase alpha subunit
MRKPPCSCGRGATARSGTRFSHAGASVEEGQGTYEGKVKRLREVGAHVVESFSDVPEATKKSRDEVVNRVITLSLYHRILA